MANMTCLVVSALLLTQSAGLFMACGQEPERPADPAPKAQPRSQLYHSFDGDKLGEKYVSSFDKAPRQFNVVANLVMTPPGDAFKLFRIKGVIAEPERKKVFNAVRDDLRQLVKASGVKVIHDPKEDHEGWPKSTASDRPIALLKMLFHGDTVELDTLHGFHFTYQQGDIVGALDVLAVRCIIEGEPKQWKIVCAVHEPAR